MKQLVLFDFDGTITSKDSYILFLKFITPASKWYKWVLAIPYVIALGLRMMDAGKCKGAILKIFTGNATKDKLDQKAKEFIEYMYSHKIILPEMLQKMNAYRDSGATVAVVSASPDIWIKPFCEKFGVLCICTELNYANNILTGKLNTPNCKGPQKVERVKAVLNLSTFTFIVAYGNDKGDAEMMAIATEKHYL